MKQTSPAMHRKDVSHDHDAKLVGIRSGLPAWLYSWGQLHKSEQTGFKGSRGACVLFFW
jgi:hypothetical protein